MIYDIVFLYPILAYLVFIFLTIVPFKFSNKQLNQYPKVSAIITSHNEEKVIEKTLRKLRMSNYPEMEIILVDSSTDRTSNIAKKYVDKIVADEGKGKSYALNLGVRKSSGEILYFLDADTLVEVGTIKKLVSALDGYKACAGMILPINKNSLISRMGRLQLSMFNLASIFSQRLLKSTLLGGKNFVIYKKTLLRMGKFQGHLSEDTNLSSRLFLKNEKVRFIDAQCYEQTPEKWNVFIKQQQRWYFGSLMGITKSVNRSAVDLRKIFIGSEAVLLMFAPAISILSSIIFLFTSNLMFLLLIFLAALVYFVSLRFLDLDDFILFPVTFVMYSIAQLHVIALIAVKCLLGTSIKWERTEKISYN